MALHLSTHIATGIAKCRLCEKNIVKNTQAIHIRGWRESAQVHSNPWECVKERRDFKTMVCEFAAENTKTEVEP